MRKIASFTLTLLFVAIGLVIPNSSATAIDAGATPAGISELASCLRTSDSLDVFYLIDNSTSLRGTDPGNARKRIIEQDVERWAAIQGLQPNLNLRISAALFNGSVTSISDWRSVSDKKSAKSVAGRISSKVNNQNLGAYTDWAAGLRHAFNQLKDSPAECKTVIWFTDGGLWPVSDSGQRESSSKRALEELCGPSGDGGLPRSPSNTGLMAQMRIAGIHIFGIQLVSENSSSGSSSQSKDEKDEPFYRSLMQPLIEESGSVESVSGKPTGEITCGENKPENQRDYASGAFFEATSPAEVAFSFMTIPAIVSGGTVQPCSADGKFWVDPGISSVEFILKDAKEFKIINSEGKQFKSGSLPKDSNTTGKISLPAVEEPEQWSLEASNKDCRMFVYPEIYLELHKKALITEQPAVITGQFVSSLTKHTKANLSAFKSVTLRSAVEGQVQASDLNQATGAFTISGYTPKTDGLAQVEATLTLETEHYKLDPIDFQETETVYLAADLPIVGKIKFEGTMIGASNPVKASVVIKPSVKFDSKVCFAAPKVIADHQDESAGKATDRSSSWKISSKPSDCVQMAQSGNSVTVVFEFANQQQAKSQAEVLFDYTIESGDFKVDDSQTAVFDTDAKRSSPLFWIWFTGLMLLGLGVPFTILQMFNTRNSKLILGNGIYRGAFKVLLEESSGQIVLDSENLSLSDADATEHFYRVTSAPKGLKDFTDPPREVQQFALSVPASLAMSAQRPVWPLSQPKFFARFPSGDFITVIAGRLRKGQDLAQQGVQKLASGQIGALAYLVFTIGDVQYARATGSKISGYLVAYVSNSGLVSADLNRNAVDSALNDSNAQKDLLELIKKVEIIQASKPVEATFGGDLLGYDIESGSTESNGFFGDESSGFNFGFGDSSDEQDSNK